MKSKIITSCITIAVMAMMFGMTALAYTNVTNKVITLLPNQIWTGVFTIERDINYKEVSAKCDSVYPETGLDTYSKIQCRIVNSNLVTISEGGTITLNEGSNYKNITILNGYMSLGTVYIQFRGNSSDGANAVVAYKGIGTY